MTVKQASKQPSKFAPLIAPAILLACLALGLGFIWWFFYGSLPKDRIIKVDPATQEPQRRGPGAGMRSAINRLSQASSAQSVRQINENSWFIRSPNATIIVRKQNKDLDLSWALNLGQPAQDVITARHAVLRDTAAAKSIGLTDATIAVIRKSNLSTLEKLSDADRNKLLPLWNAYQAAPEAQKPAAAQKLVAAVDAAAKASLEPARQAMLARVKEMSAILTPQLIARLPKPTTR